MLWYSSALIVDLGNAKIAVINFLEPVPSRRQVEITKATHKLVVVPQRSPKVLEALKRDAKVNCVLII